MSIPAMPKMPDTYYWYQALEDCWKNDLFRNQTKPFDQDFEPSVIPDQMKYVPISDRKPLVQLPIGNQIVETIISYTFGAENFPRIVAKTDLQLFGPETDTEQTNVMLQDLLNDLVNTSFLKTTIVKAGRHAIAQGSCLVVIKIIRGRVRHEIINKKYVRDLVIDPSDNDRVLSFKEVIPVLCQEYPNTPPCWYWQCREFNNMGEVYYKLVECQDGVEPVFNLIDEERTPQPHNLGFCPAILVEYNDDQSVFMYTNQIENIRFYSYFESYILNGQTKNMNPQAYWSGENPDVIREMRRSSDSVWLFPPGSVGALAPNPQAYQFAMLSEERLREMILRGCRVVEIPNSNYQSGDALKIKLAPELNLINETRVELGDKVLVNILYMMLAVVIHYGNRVERQITDGSEIDVVSKVYIGSGLKIPPNINDGINPIDCDIKLGWGEIFIPTAESRNLDVQTAVMAIKGEDNETPLFSQYSVRQKMATHFDITDMAREQQQINKEEIRQFKRKVANYILESLSSQNDVKGLIAVMEQLENSNDNGVDQVFEYLTTITPKQYEQASERVEDAIDQRKEEDEPEHKGD